MPIDRRDWIEREDNPPFDHLAFVPIYSAMPGVNIHLITLSRGIHGVWTHFHLERTIPCVGRGNGCLCSTLSLSKRWKGYLGAWDPLLCRVCLAELTLDCYRNSRGTFERMRGNMRGLPMMLWRLGPKRNAPVRVQFGVRLPDYDDKLPPEPDISRCLRRIWGIPE